MPNKAVYKLNMKYGRMGTLTGIFVADPAEVKNLIDSQQTVYFGEALGKHSEVYGPIGENELVMVSDDQVLVKLFEEFNLETGYNPFDYLE